MAGALNRDREEEKKRKERTIAAEKIGRNNPTKAQPECRLGYAEKREKATGTRR